jgi:uncharacterized protein (TIGR00251 family)
VTMKQILRVKVLPKSSKEEIIEKDPLIVKVKAAPERGAANAAVVRLLSRHYGKNVRIISGTRSRRKIVELRD